MYINKDYNDCYQRKTTCAFIYIYKNQKSCKTFLYTKIQTLCKKQDNFRYVFIIKNPDTLRYAIFKKLLKLAFIYKKHNTLRYVTFLYKKSQTLRKIKTICVTFLYTKIQTLRVTQFFIEFLNLERRGGHFYMQKQYTLRYIFICKKMHLVLRFIYKKPYIMR